MIEMDDTDFGAPKLGKRGRGAAGKAKVVVAVENRGDKLGFATMCQVEKVSPYSVDSLRQVSLNGI